MVNLAGEMADGALPAMVPPEFTVDARRLLGPDKLLIGTIAVMAFNGWAFPKPLPDIGAAATGARASSRNIRTALAVAVIPLPGASRSLRRWAVRLAGDSIA